MNTRVWFTLLLCGTAWSQVAAQESVALLRSIKGAASEVMLEKWAVGRPSQPLSTWSSMIGYRISSDVEKLLRVHFPDSKVKFDGLNEGGGPVNLDYYAIRVAKLPNHANGKAFTPEEFLLLMRAVLSDQQLPQDPDQQARKTLVQFRPAGRSTLADWAAAKRGTLMKLGFGNVELAFWRNDQYCRKLDWIGADDLCRTVDKALREFAGDQAYIMIVESVPSSFRVATVRDGFAYPFSTAIGSHPVAGFREFGFSKRQNATGYTFYVIGADQVNDLNDVDDNLRRLAEHFVFASGAAHWRLLMSELQKFVTANGGKIDGEPTLDRGTATVFELKTEGLWPLP